MTIVTYKKAEAIHEELKNYRKLRRICDYSFTKYTFTKKFLWLSTYSGDEVVLCDNELTKIIREYCDKKISEFEKQLEAL